MKRRPGDSENLRELRWSEARWQAILETARDAIVSIDRQGRITLFNRAAEQIFGFAASEVLGQNVSTLMPSPYREEHDGYIRRYERTGEPHAIGRIREVEGRHRDGHVFPIELSVSEARVGEDVVYVAIVRDVGERHQMERELRHERDFAERLIETAQGIVLVLDRDGRIVRFNPYLEALSGYALEEVRGRDWFDTFLPEADRPSTRELFHKALENIEVRGHVNPILTRDGRLRDVEWHAKTLRDAEGRIEGVLSIGVDITARLAAARRLTAQYAVTRVLAESPTLADATPRILQTIGQGVGCQVGELWSIDVTGDRLHRAGAWYEQGLAANGFEVGSRDLTFVRGQGFPGTVWESGRPEHIADVATHPSFSRKALVTQLGLRGGIAFPIRSETRTTGVIVLFHRGDCEIDRELMRMLEALGSQIGSFIERKRAEEVIHASETRFFAFMNNSPAVAFMKDEEGRYVYVNRPFEERFQREAAAVQGTTDYDLWPRETARQLRANDAAVLAANRTVEILETVPTPNGELHDWLTFKFPIRDAAGRRFLAGMAVDITDRLRAEARLREMQRVAQERERLADIGAITAKIAHDLGNPLGALSMQTQVMLRRARRDERAPIQNVIEPLEQMAREVRRLEAMIREIMSFAREQRLDLHPLEAEPFLGEIVELWRPFAEERKVELRLDISADTGTFHADPALLRRVVDNLVKNAFEAIDDSGGSITLGAEGLPNQRVLLSVKDTGGGVLEGTQVFRLFETTKPGGSGLGLAVSRQIVHAHGGEISWQKLEPHGTSFHVELPRLAQATDPLGEVIRR